MTPIELSYLTPIIEGGTKQPFAVFNKLNKTARQIQVSALMEKVSAHKQSLVAKNIPQDSFLLKSTDISLRLLQKYTEEYLRS